MMRATLDYLLGLFRSDRPQSLLRWMVSIIILPIVTTFIIECFRQNAFLDFGLSNTLLVTSVLTGHVAGKVMDLKQQAMDEGAPKSPQP